MSPPHTPPAGGGQDLLAEEQFFAVLPFARQMFRPGITPLSDFGVLEFDATALALAHRVGRLFLSLETLHAVTNISRGEDYQLSSAERRDIDGCMRDLLHRSGAILNAMRTSR